MHSWPFENVAPWLFMMGMLSIVTGCVSIKDANIRQQIMGSNCNQQNVYTYTEVDLPHPLHTLTIESELQNQLSHRDLNMANAIGILADLTRYIRLKNDLELSDLEKRLTTLELKQRIDHKINMASLEVSAIASEMDCEEERTSQVANYLKGSESETESKLTVAAIVVGATGAIATGGVVKNETASNSVGIATGITEASLGLLMLFNNRKIDFYHERNALREVWEGKPNQEATSVRRQIIDKWKNFGQISENEDEEGQTVTPIYFGDGGKYTTEQLINRADMYDQLESHITLMKQDLKALSLALERL